jgi:hypothetical protein
MNDFKERIGVGETHYGLGRTAATRQRIITAEEGPRKGRTAAVMTDHASGRVDANVVVDSVKRSASQKEL